MQDLPFSALATTLYHQTKNEISYVHVLFTNLSVFSLADLDETANELNV